MRSRMTALNTRERRQAVSGYTSRCFASKLQIRGSRIAPNQACLPIVLAVFVEEVVLFLYDAVSVYICALVQVFHEPL